MRVKISTLIYTLKSAARRYVPGGRLPAGDATRTDTAGDGFSQGAGDSTPVMTSSRLLDTVDGYVLCFKGIRVRG